MSAFSLTLPPNLNCFLFIFNPPHPNLSLPFPYFSPLSTVAHFVSSPSVLRRFSTSLSLPLYSLPLILRSILPLLLLPPPPAPRLLSSRPYFSPRTPSSRLVARRYTFAFPDRWPISTGAGLSLSFGKSYVRLSYNGQLKRDDIWPEH